MHKAVSLFMPPAEACSDNPTGQTGTQRMARMTGAALIVAVTMMTVTLAATARDIEGGIKAGTQQLYNIMTAVVLPIAAVFFAWNAFKALFGGERGMEQAKKNMLTIVIVLALVYLAPVVVTQVGGWFSPSSNWSF